MIDDVEVGRRVAPHFRVALEVDDCAAASERATAGGAVPVAPPTRTPWDSLNARFDAPGEVHLTLFQELGSSGHAELVALGVEHHHVPERAVVGLLPHVRRSGRLEPRHQVADQSLALDHVPRTFAGDADVDV